MNNTAKAIVTGMMFTLTAVWASAQSLRVWADDMTLKADGNSVTRLRVSMTDDGTPYSGFQMAIEVPKGIHIAQRTSGRELMNDATLDPCRFEGLAHVLGTNMPSATLIKVGCIDLMGNREFYRDDAGHNPVEHLFDLGLVADKSMEDGKYTLRFWDCKMIHADASYDESPEFTATLTIVDGVPSSVDVTRQGEQDKGDTYDLGGRKVQEPTHRQIYVRKGRKVAR